MTLRRFLKTFLHYLLAILFSLLLLLLVVTGLVYFLAVSDQEKVPELVEQTCRDQFGASATFTHYRFQYLDYFPFLSLSLEDVVLRDPAGPAESPALMNVGEITIVFRPWKLLRREFEVKSLVIDRAAIRFHRSGDGYFNAAFLRRGNVSVQTDPGFDLIFSIDGALIKSLSFSFVDSLRGKHHHFDLRQTEVAFEQLDSFNRLRLRGDCFFHGLVFKSKNGPFLPNQSTQLDLHLTLERGKNRFDLRPSTLKIEEDLYTLSGYLLTSDPGYLQLIIANEGVLLTNARSMLATNLQQALNPYRISRPIKTRIRIEGPTIPNQPAPIDLRFSVRDAEVASPTLRFTQAHLEGTYLNNCDTTGPITPHSDCLTLETFTGKLFDTIPVIATYHAQDMKDPTVEVKGAASFALPALGNYLPPEQFALSSGQVNVDFSYRGTPRLLLTPSELDPTMQLSGHANIQDGALIHLPSRTDLSRLFAQLTFDENTLRFEDVRFHLQRDPFRISGRIHDFVPFVLSKAPRPRARLWIDAPRLDLDRFVPTATARNTPPMSATTGTPFHARIADLTAQITEKLDADLQVRSREITFRKLRAEDVHLSARFRRDCRTANGDRPPGSCLVIDSLTARIYDHLPLRASLRLTDLQDPQVEMDLKLSSPLSRFRSLLPLSQLRFYEGQVDWTFHYEGSLDDYANLKAATLDANLSGTATLHGASLEYLPAGYHFRDVNGTFRFDERDLQIDSLGLILNENTLLATGRVSGLLPFLYHQDQKLEAILEIEAPRLDLNRFRDRKPEVDGGEGPNSHPLARNPVERTIGTVLNRLEGNLRVRTDTLRFRELEFTDVRFASRLSGTCQNRTDATGCVEIEDFSANLFGHAPLQARVTATNLEDLFLVADARIELPVRDLNRLFAPANLNFKEGRLDVDFHYEGHPDDQFDLESAVFKPVLRGQAKITGGAFDYPSRGYEFRQLQGKFLFDANDLTIQELTVGLNRNVIHAKGQVDDFFPFLFFDERKKLKADLDIASPYFDLDQFKAPQKFSAQRAVSLEKPAMITGLLDTLLANLEAELTIDLDRVHYRNFEADSVSGRLTLTPDRLHFRDTRMQLAGGEFQLDGLISNLKKNAPRLDVKASFLETDIARIFFAFRNFGQGDLTHENIQGILTAEASFRARADANYDLQPATMEGRFDLRVQDGELIRVPGLMDMNGFLFKKRNMANIRFATLENTFNLQGQDLFIDHFYVFSSALTFGVEGRYCLGPGQHTDLLFEVPVANIFRGDLQKEALESLKERGTGLSILLRATETEEDELNFRWLLSRRPFDREE